MRIFRHYIPGISLVWLTGDVVVVLAGYVAMTALAGKPTELGPAFVLAAATPVLMHVSDMYGMHLVLGRREAIARILVAQFGVAVIVATVGFLIPAVQMDRVTYLAVLGSGTVGLVVWRLAWLLLWSPVRSGHGIVVIGTGPIGDAIAELRHSSARPFRIAGFIADHGPSMPPPPEGYPLLGSTTDLLHVVDELRPDLLVVAQGDRRGSFPAAALLECRLRGTAIEDWPAFYEKVTGKILVSDLRPSWLIFSDGFVKTRRAEIVKRAFDVVISLIGIVLSSPIMLAAALAIRLESPGPIVYRQTRVGRWDEPFVIWKFRSMQADAEALSGAVWAMKGDTRTTRVGRLIRRARVDELPQLFNVLAGHMSFIGPRPERPEFIEELERSIPFYRARLSVKPGITGWAQVRYSYGASVEDALEKLQYDLYYIKNLSLFLDVLILISTVQVVLLGRGR